MNHAMFRYVMYDLFEGGGKFNFFFETFESFLLDNKNRQISFYSATRSSFIVPLVVWYVMETLLLVFVILLLTDSLSYSHKYKQHNGGD